MTLFYNIEYEGADLIFVEGDPIDMTFSVDENDAAYPLTGKTINMQVRRLDGLLLKDMTSTGSPCGITIIGNTFNIYCEGFDERGLFEYDIEVVGVGTIMRGYAVVKKQITK